MQNIIVVNVPNAKTAELVVALNSVDLQVDVVGSFWRGAIACTVNGVLQVGDCWRRRAFQSGW